MTRELYLYRLQEYLHGLPREEQESAIRYCEEYFDEAGEDQFDQAVADLGTPEKFAAQIRRNYTSRQNAHQEKAKKEHKENRNWALIVGLGLLAIPVLLPLAIVALVLVLVAVFLMLLPVLIVGLLIFIFFSLTVALLAVAMKTAFVSVASAGLAVGGLLVTGSLFLLCVAAMIQLVKKVLPWLSDKIHDAIQYLKERRSEL